MDSWIKKRIILGIVKELDQWNLALTDGDSVSVTYEYRTGTEIDDMTEKELEREIAMEIMGLSELEARIIEYSDE